MSELFTSRKFWALAFGLIVTIIASLIPGFDLDADGAAALAVVIVSYVIGVAVDPGPGGWRGVLQSRKFWAAAVGLVMIFLDAFHVVLPAGLTSEMLITLAVLVGGYIAGVAWELPKAQVITGQQTTYLGSGEYEEE